MNNQLFLGAMFLGPVLESLASLGRSIKWLLAVILGPGIGQVRRHADKGVLAAHSASRSPYDAYLTPQVSRREALRLMRRPARSTRSARTGTRR